MDKSKVVGLSLYMINGLIEKSTINFKLGKILDLREDILYHSLSSAVRQDDHFSILFIFKVYSIYLNKQVSLVLAEETKGTKQKRLRSTFFGPGKSSGKKKNSGAFKISVHGPEHQGLKTYVRQSGDQTLSVQKSSKALGLKSADSLISSEKDKDLL